MTQPTQTTDPGTATRAQRELLIRHAVLARRRGRTAWARDLTNAARMPELCSRAATEISILAVGLSWQRRWPRALRSLP